VKVVFGSLKIKTLMSTSKHLAFILFVAINFPFAVNCQWVSDSSVNNLVHNGQGNDNVVDNISDGSNGSIIVFSKNNALYAQKINHLGQTVWGNTTSAKLISTNISNVKTAARAVSDSVGGVYVAWSEADNDTYTNIYCQHISVAGNMLWGDAGKKVSDYNGVNNAFPLLSVSSNGNLFVTWTTFIAGLSIKVKVQQFAGDGLALWNPDGMQLSASAFNIGIGIVASFEDVIVIYEDSRNDIGSSYSNYENGGGGNGIGNKDIYAQKVSKGGATQWPAEQGAGVPVSVANLSQWLYNETGNWDNAVPDGKGGAIIAFYDYRRNLSYPPFPSRKYFDVSAQRITAEGQTVWDNGQGSLLISQPVSMFTLNYRLGAISDNKGGLFAVFSAYSNEGASNLIHLLPDGAKEWSNTLQTAASQQNRKLVTDRAGGVIIFYDGGVPYDPNFSTYVAMQKANADGILAWGGAGKIISFSPNNTFNSQTPVPFVCKGLNDSLVVAWTDARNPDNGFDIYVSKTDAGGNFASTPNSVVSTIKNGTWVDPTTWVGGLFPNTTSDVVVMHDLVITADAVCRTLKVIPPAKITVMPNVHLTILQ
jgi:hypothetical protein